MARQEPISFFEFKERFNSEDACREHLFRLRWPNGFECPRCGNKSYYPKRKRNHYQCCSCRYQASVTAGTVMDKSRIPLEKWFWAVYLVSAEKRGHSALALRRELGICYKPAWYLFQRIRTAMMERDWEYMLSSMVEIDDAYFGAADTCGKRGRGTDKSKTHVSLPLNEWGKPRYIKMEFVDDLKSDTKVAFVEINIRAGSTISSDAYSSYKQLKKEGFDHEPKAFNPKTDKEHLKWLHTIVSNAKAMINGTFHGLDQKHLPLTLQNSVIDLIAGLIPMRF